MALIARSQVAGPTDTVQLRAQFKDIGGVISDTDSVPQITITSPSGGVVVGPTSAGVYKISTGTYGFDYTIGMQGPLGVWSDYWEATIGGNSASGSFNFVVYTSQLPGINSDGYVHLGDDPGFNYSQAAINNINNLLKTIKARLNSSGKVKTRDAFGNEIFVDCDIFTTDQLVVFAAASLTMFNQIPHFTFFTFENSEIMEQFHEVLVQGAVIYALSSKALIEKGREFNITDNGVTFSPPTISDILGTQWNAELTNHTEKVKYIKASMKPAPLGLGTLRPLAASPQFLRLRHLRARQII